MIDKNVAQGSQAWHELRFKYFTASDAPAMLNCSPYRNREDVLYEKKTGITRDVDRYTQMIFDDGHRFEALARPLAEQYAGEEFFPVVGVKGKQLASFDGLDVCGEIGLEHKTLNQRIATCKSVAELPIDIRVQMQQQIYVSGAKKILFMASKWDENNQIIGEPVYFWYESDPALSKTISDGWAQFEIDLENYKYEAKEVEEKPAYKTKSLPALNFEVSTKISTLGFADFKEKARAVIESINLSLKNDADFDRAANEVKWCKGVESNLETHKEHVRAQISNVEDVIATLESLKEEVRGKRLILSKSILDNGKLIKSNMVLSAQNEFKDHLEKIQEMISEVRLPIEEPNFGILLKGMSSYKKMQEKIDLELANAKNNTFNVFNEVKEKVVLIAEQNDGLSLFPDLHKLIAEPLEEFKNTLDARVAAREKRIKEEKELEEFRKKKAADDAVAAKKAEDDRLAAEGLERLSGLSEATAEPQQQGEIKTHEATVSQSVEQNAAELKQTRVRFAQAPMRVEQLADEIAAGIGAKNERAIRGFINSKDFGKEENKILAILVEFVKYQNQFKG